jgi:hypothetical protein
MPSDEWVIEIKKAPGGGVFFLPDVRNAKPGDALRAKAFDLVSWTNRTDQEVALEAPVANFNRTIPAGQPSTAFVLSVEPKRLEYQCINPPQRHVIEIVTGPLVA